MLFHHEYYSSKPESQELLELVGVDISSNALGLARENLVHQIASQATKNRNGPASRTRSLHSTGFVQADVLKHDGEEIEDNAGPLPIMQALDRVSGETPPLFDILTSNPPYISPTAFERTTARSVRLFEPRLALVPPTAETAMSDTEIGDLFYPRLLDISQSVKAKICLFEVADLEQATRLAAMALKQGVWERVEIWRDDPQVNPEIVHTIKVGESDVRIRGSGNGRSVLVHRSEATNWLDL